MRQGKKTARRTTLGLFCVGIVLMTGLLAGCSLWSQPQPQPQPQPPGPVGQKDFTAQNDALKQLFPAKSGFIWAYDGFAEYSHMMELKAVSLTDGQTVYTVAGEIGDPSGGEAKFDLSLALTYTIKEGVLLQNKTAPRMMDTFAAIELLRGPLNVQSQWEQKTRDASGKEYQLVCTITEIKEEKGLKTYTIEYKDKNSDFYEKRQIRQGSGIVFFEKKIRLNNEPIEMGYYLYEEASGYRK